NYRYKAMDGVTTALELEVGTGDIDRWYADREGKALTGDGEPERLQGLKVSTNLFEVLGIPPLLGRTFANAEGHPGNNQVVIISHDLWQRRFAGDPEVIGRTILLNGTSYMVVGVMPGDFRFILKTDVWTPLALTPAEENERDSIFLHPL